MSSSVALFNYVSGDTPRPSVLFLFAHALLVVLFYLQIQASIAVFACS